MEELRKLKKRGEGLIYSTAASWLHRMIEYLPACFLPSCTKSYLIKSDGMTLNILSIGYLG
jgi:hypothetical protein